MPEVPGYPILGTIPKVCFENAYSVAMSACFETAKDYGISYSWIGTFPLIYLRDPAVLRQAFVSNADSITRVGPNGDGPFSNLQRMIGDVAATADGNDWHRWRNALHKDFYSPMALKCSYEGMLRLVKRHVQKMRDDEEGSDFALTMEAFALDGVWYVALGLDSASELSSDLSSTLTQLVSVADDMGHFARHGLRNFLSRKSFREPDHIERSVRDQIDGLGNKLLDQNLGKLDPQQQRDETCKPCFLGRVSQDSGGSSKALVTGDVLAQARQVFTLGHEASAIVLFWANYELSLHPEVIEKMRLEFRQNGCNNGDPDFHALRKMTYLDSVVCEIFRPHPPISKYRTTCHEANCDSG